jgi:hypothetical protein
MASDAMRWSPISYDDGVLTPLIVAAALLSTAYGPSFTATDFAELLAVRGQGAAVERVTLRNEKHAFELQSSPSRRFVRRDVLFSKPIIDVDVSADHRPRQVFT